MESTKKRLPILLMFLLSLLVLGQAPARVPAQASTQTATQTGRWTEKRANDWYQQQPWLVGANYIPATAINELEMWQAETFDPAQKDKKQDKAENNGMNTMRVFLHDLP